MKANMPICHVHPCAIFILWRAVHGSSLSSPDLALPGCWDSAFGFGHLGISKAPWHPAGHWPYEGFLEKLGGTLAASSGGSDADVLQVEEGIEKYRKNIGAHQNTIDLRTFYVSYIPLGMAGLNRFMFAYKTGTCEQWAVALIRISCEKRGSTSSQTVRGVFALMDFSSLTSPSFAGHLQGGLPAKMKPSKITYLSRVDGLYGNAKILYL